MNKFMKKNHKAMKKLQKGFTLIELAIVGIFLGLLAVFAISQFGGNATDVTRANAIREAATKIGDNWSILSQNCNVGNNVTALNLTTNAADAQAASANLSVLLGTAQVNNAFNACYAAAGIRPLTGMSVGAAGAETIEGLPVTLSSPTATTIGITFTNVPDNIATRLFNRLSSANGAPNAVTLPAAADNADAQFRFAAGAAGTPRTITILRAL